jgi:two-component system KDP operon response regulator KdpE
MTQRDTSEVLLVDDDPGIRKVVQRAFEGTGLDIVAAPDRAGALQALGERPFALAILDINLPDASGLDLCREIQRKHGIPVVMLTVVADEGDAVRALESGADDYVRKPFGSRELVARIQSVLRRSHAAGRSADQNLRAGPLELDSTTHRASIEGDPLPLTPTEYRLLAHLVQNAGRVLTHDQLLRSVWGPTYAGEHPMLHVTMRRLRHTLGRLAQRGAIRTMPGIGYEFTVLNGD